MSSSLSASLLPQVVSLINTYGVEVTVYRDVYENELGVKTLKNQKQAVATLRVVIDNSKTTSSNNRFKVEGMIRPQITATIYYAYDSNVILEREDYIILDGVKYVFNIPQDVLHYHILYQVSAEVTINE